MLSSSEVASFLVKRRRKIIVENFTHFVPGGIQQINKPPEKIEKNKSDNLRNYNSSSNSDVNTKNLHNSTRSESSFNVTDEIQGNSSESLQFDMNGIGGKLLLQMGFQPGKGLGKNLQGISAPIDACLRKGREGLGATDGHEKSNKITSDSNDKNKIRSVHHNDIRILANSKYSIETIGMLTKNYSLPEIRENLNSIVVMYKMKIDTQYQKIARLTAKSKIQSHRKTVTRFMIFIEKILNILLIVNRLIINEADVTIVDITQAFRQFYPAQLYKKFMNCELAEVAAALVAPKIKYHLATWSPLYQPHYHRQLIDEWRNILVSGMPNGRHIRPYDQLIWRAVMPSIRRAVDQWSCQQPERLIEFLEHWHHLLPTFILNHILTELILPKLIIEVENCDPLTDLIHYWIHPWLPWMNDCMDAYIYPIIRRKLSWTFNTWHPSDRTARWLLEPWYGVFNTYDFERFLVKNILPKLQYVLNDFVINPRAQILDQWNWIFEWEKILPIDMMIELLNNFFFPQWLRILTLWLKCSPNFDEVIEWYLDWKNKFNAELQADPSIKYQLDKGLAMINQSARIHLIIID